MLPPVDFKDIQEKLSTHFRPWNRSFQFWVRAVDIYTGYKVSLSLSLSLCMYLKFVSFFSIHVKLVSFFKNFDWVYFGFGGNCLGVSS